jgi:hypothetical protein
LGYGVHDLSRPVNNALAPFSVALQRYNPFDRMGFSAATKVVATWITSALD